MRKPTATTFRRKLDSAFSKWIRNRDTVNGVGSCITCQKYTELECGHFIPRQYTATRWLETNAHGQCPRCNKWLHGDQAEYYQVLVRKYGQAAVNELMRLKHTTRKYSLSDLKELIERYS